MTSLRAPATGGSDGRRFPVGAEVRTDGSTHFRIWGPRRRSVEVVVTSPGGGSPRPSLALHAEGNEYFSGSAPDTAPGSRYWLRIDGADRLFPDPASRFQPEGPEGPSEIVDPGCFRWSDERWPGIGAAGQVIYEMHIGTFTQAGTWTAAAAELRELARIGMTALELMPVADFSGAFGWGYDGVCLFAPTRLYGRPDDFRRFVDRAHAVGLGVILDVVYNHFGSIGHTLPQFSEDYATDRHPNEWGAAVNFDGRNCERVREFFLANARYWIEEFHLDGLRFDATQAIHDDSESHILTELVKTVREAGHPRRTLIVAENEPQKVRMMRPPEAGGHGMDAAWNDDFHHAAMVRLTGHNEAYYSDYRGSTEEFLQAVQHGFLYQGQRSQWQEQPRGTSTRGLPATAFVTFLQNHDQVANSAAGARIDRLTSPGRLRAMTALWLLAPQTPMFFQGQEFAASAPFLYFADNSGDQAERVAHGRAEFLSQFPSLDTPEARSHFALPHERATFERSHLDSSERQSHAPVYALHCDLLRLRREDGVFRQQRADRIRGATLGPDCLLLRYLGEEQDDRLLLVNFGRDLRLSPCPQPLLAPPEGCDWASLWNSEGVEYGGQGAPVFESTEGWRIHGESALVLRSVPKTEGAS